MKKLAGKINLTCQGTKINWTTRVIFTVGVVAAIALASWITLRVISTEGFILCKVVLGVFHNYNLSTLIN